MLNVFWYIAIMFATKARIFVPNALVSDLDPHTFRVVLSVNRERSVFTKGHAEQTASFLTLINRREG